jgi:Protein of unknown function (DUF3137)
MQNLMPLLFIAAVIVAIIAAIYSVIAQRKRREGLFMLAQRLGLDFRGERDFEIPGRFGFLKQLSLGDDRYAANVLSGKYQQNEILAFDYHFATYHTDKNGTHKDDHWFSFFILTLPAVFPDLTIRRENFFTKVAEVFGYQDIKFESAEFSKAFNVRSRDKKFAYDVCNAQMMEYLLANRDLSIEIENEVIALAFKARLSVEQFEFDLRRLVEIRSRLPEFLFTKEPA